MNQNPWINNPSLSDIDPAKLQMLTSLAEQAQGKNQKELLPFLMAAAAESRSGNMSFNSEETNAVIQALKTGKTPQEIQKIDKLCAMIRQFQRR